MNKGKLRHAFCQNCSSSFVIKDAYNIYGKKCPLLLPCGHSQCEICVRDSLKVNNKVVCKVCTKETTYGNIQSVENFRNTFPLNIFLVGSILLRTCRSKIGGDSLISFKTKSNAVTKKPTVEAERCFECNSMVSEVICKQCNNTYCNSCFSMVHSSARSLKTHERLSLDRSSPDTKLTVQYCLIHTDQKIEFYCNSCNKNMCSYCAISEHMGHQVLHKKTENIKKLDELKAVLEKVEQLYSRLKYSQRKVLNINQSDSADTELQVVEKVISSHFDCLHALLQLKEAEMLKELNICKIKSMESLQEVATDLELSAKLVKDQLELGKNALQIENLSYINVDDVIKNLEESLKIPCHLVFQTSEDDEDSEKKNTRVLFSVLDESIFDKISNHCEITVPTCFAKYVLHSENDLPKDYVIEEIPAEVTNDKFQDVSLNFNMLEISNRHDDVTNSIKSSSSVTSSVCDASETSSRHSKLHLAAADSINFKKADRDSHKSSNPTSQLKQGLSLGSAESISVNKYAIPQKGFIFTDLTAGTMETVSVCHFMSPSDFYIHRKGTEIELRKMMYQFDKMRLKSKNHPEEALEGTIYLVQYENDKKWYRGCVEKVDSLDKIRVIFIDYGNTDVVSIESLRHLPPRFALIPPMAIQCKLFDCYPNPGRDWSTEAIKMMASLISGSNLTMYVMRTDEGFKLEIDLTKFDEDSPLSVRDALIFHELASYIVTNSVSYKDDRICKKDLFFSGIVFKEGQTFDVAVTHIINPSNFFVQVLNKNSTFVKKISHQMNDVYRRDLKDLVYSPYVGMSVAAFDFFDGTWHRAQVTKLPGNRQVEVFFVDSGNTKVLPWDNLRKLQNRFSRMSAQAVRCALSDVIPSKKGKFWPDCAIKTFLELVSEKKLKASVVAVTPAHLKVALYESDEFYDRCINALFVKCGQAESVGITSTLAEFPKYGFKKDSSLNRSSGRNDMQAEHLFETVSIHSRKKYSKSLSRSLQSISTVSSLEVKSSTSDDGMISTRLPVTVRKVINPGSFYVSFNIQIDDMKKLFEDMNIYYKSSTPTRSDIWEKGMICAVFKEDEDQWFRGIIEENLPEDKFQVLLKDIADTVAVNSSCLATLVDDFCSVRDGAFKCHLAGIVAAGGQKTWPGIAIEVFEEHLEEANNKIFFSQKGEVDPEEKSLPAELWIKHTIDGGPLEPSRHEWRSINKYLIDQGFALPDKSDPSITEQPISLDFNSDKSSNSSNSLASSTNVSEWVKKNNLVCEKVNEPVKQSSAVTKKIIKSSSESVNLEESKLKDWLPPQPLKELSFVAFPTYVDHSCNIYIQEPSSSDTLNVIQNALWSRFKDSKPMPHDLFWFPGQLCIAQYHIDKKWYRAKVLEVNADNTVTVEMVDYGNVEICKAAELRKNICMTNIPLQCHKCSFKQLQPISEDGQWTIPVLDFIHATVVEKFCPVHVKGTVGNYNLVSLKCPGGLDLSEILLNMNYAKYVTDEVVDEEDRSVIIEDECCSLRSSSPPSIKENVKRDESFHETPLDNDVSHKELDFYSLDLQCDNKNVDYVYKEIELLDDTDEFLAEVTSILSPTSVITQIYHTNEYLKSKFINLQEEMQKSAQFQPKLDNLKVGQPCIIQYSTDQRWYRGQILDINPDDDTVKVKYVDYGNMEIIPKGKVLAIKEEWMAVPKQGLQCFLWGVKHNEDYDIKTCVELLQENIFVSPLLVKVKQREPLLRVQLFREGGTELVYQKLIDNNIFQTIEEVD